MKKTFSLVLTLSILAVFLTYCFAGRYDVEVRPTVEVEPYKSDNVRMSESYERIINRYQDMLEKQMYSKQQPSTEVLAKLEKIDKKIDSLSKRLSKIEIALKINNTKPNKSLKQNPTKESNIIKEAKPAPQSK